MDGQKKGRYVNLALGAGNRIATACLQNLPRQSSHAGMTSHDCSACICQVRRACLLCVWDGLGEVLIEEGLGILSISGCISRVNLAHEDMQSRRLQTDFISVTRVACRATLPIVCLHPRTMISAIQFSSQCLLVSCLRNGYSLNVFPGCCKRFAGISQVKLTRRDGWWPT